jgi:putative oxidoreductase
MTSSGLLVLRLTLALVLVAHGAHALFGTFAGPNIGRGGLSQTTSVIAALNLAPAFGIAVAAGGIQLGGGLLVGVGWLTRVSAAITATYLVLMLFRDSARWGFFLNWRLDPTRGHGMEFSLLLIGGLACLCVTGAGRWSIDGVRSRSAAARAAGRARLRAR